MAYNELINEDRLFELYEIMIGYASDGERESLAQHIYDWLRAWEAPSTVFEGMIDQDTYLAEISKGPSVGEYPEEDEDEFENEEDQDWDE